MQAPIHRQVGISALFFLAVYALPAIARAYSDETKTIGNAVVRILVIGGKTFLAVKSGGPLVLKYADGTVMANIPAGTAMMVGGLTGGPTVDGNSLKLAPITAPPAKSLRRAIEIALSAKSPALTFNPPYQNKGSSEETSTYTVTPGNTRRVVNSMGLSENTFSGSWTESLSVTSSYDRDQISIVSGN